MKTKTAKPTMVAKFIGESVRNGVNYDGEKERVNDFKVIGLKSGKMSELVDCRFWSSRSSSSSVIYCTIWIRGNQQRSGKGKASGYGYHKQSAALQQALDSAGVHLFGSNYSRDENEPRDMSIRAHIDGCGDSAMRAALESIVSALGYRQWIIV